MKHSVEAIKLANGAEGLFVHVPDATVMTFELNFRAGEYLVEREKWETPHLMEHILLGANQNIPKARAFQAEFEKNGAYCNASTGAYEITYEAECADFEWARIIDLLTTAITKPLFLEEEYKAEFGNVREELSARSNNHFRHLNLSLREAYGFLVVTDQERIRLMENVTLNDVRKHYASTHTASNLRFVIAGNIAPKRKRILQGLLENIDLPKGEGRLELPIENPKKIIKPLYIENKTVDNIYFYIDTFMKRRLSEPEADTLALLNTMLTETLHSNILGTAREKGLVYSMSSGFNQGRGVSNWWFGAQVMPGNAPALFDVISKELIRIFEGQLSDEDLKAAKQYSLGKHQRSEQTVSAVMSGYSGRYFFDGYIDDYYKIPERIEAVSKDMIVATAKNMFEQQVRGFGALGNFGDEFAHKLYDKVLPVWLRSSL